MLRHIVAWKIKEENKAENMKHMKELLEALVGKIDEIKSLQVGFNESGGKYDVVLITDFLNKQDHENYDNHPEHQKVRKFIRSVCIEREVIDYDY